MKAKWLVLLLVPLIAISFSGEAAYAAPADDALSSLYQYYEICSNEDIEAYMDIMDFSDGEEFAEDYIENTRDLALTVWSAYDILSYELSNIEVSVDEEVEYALISYHIYQELRGADSEGIIKTVTMDMDYVALMHNIDGWKVVYLMPRVTFEENMQNMSPIIAVADIMEGLAMEQEPINLPPTASFSIMPENPQVGDTIVVVGTASDPDGDMLTCWWYLDGEHVWELDDFSSWEWEDTEAGEYTITLVVDDGRDGSDEYSMAVTVVGDGGGGVGGSVIIGILFIIIIAAVAVFLIRRRRKKGVTQQEQDSWRDVGPPA